MKEISYNATIKLANTKEFFSFTIILTFVKLIRFRLLNQDLLHIV